MTEGFMWQALNAVAFFFKYVLGVEDPVFAVKTAEHPRPGAGGALQAGDPPAL